ncbi:MAG: DUF104 domain-containing protein [ANME-2 cluster archaeon]|nr:DUF104 domain-containing protein [ANME-2 cluster archaeon]MBC2700973.1 DUF104 domain-containing protein [ANME-2 cluster archaeon]MBC2709111.1 DUF104 domain-containing protein [ANME-2 cluster archaeon]MBC2747451.1 DUF104 domain-containing protein [ANME-2 cluster archaeon]MBC2764270.1 DUF104 domain-containing protein [ANME-2 cluster archaeon]
MNSAKTKTVHAHFDGKVLRPDEPVDLKPNVRYRITIEDEDSSAKQSIWEVLDEFSGKIEGPEDWSEEHDHYLYGIPKQKKR